MVWGGVVWCSGGIGMTIIVHQNCSYIISINGAILFIKLFGTFEQSLRP